MTDFLAYLTKAPRHALNLESLIQLTPEDSQPMIEQSNKVQRAQEILSQFKKSHDSLTSHADQLIAAYAPSKKSEIKDEDEGVIQLKQVQNNDEYEISNEQSTFDVDIEIDKLKDLNDDQLIEEATKFQQEMDSYLQRLKSISLNTINTATLQQQVEPEMSNPTSVKKPVTISYEDKINAQKHQQKQYLSIAPTSRNLNKSILCSGKCKDTIAESLYSTRKSINQMIQNPSTCLDFNFQQQVEKIERQNIFQELCYLDDPSKIILTLSKGLLNMLSLASTGRFSDIVSWPEIRIQLSKNKYQIFKQMKAFERVARYKRYNESHVNILTQQYINSTEIQLALKSTKRHFAIELILYLSNGVNYMQQIIEKKIKTLTNPVDYQSQARAKSGPKYHTRYHDLKNNENQESRAIKIIRKKQNEEGSIDEHQPFQNINNRINTKRSVSPLINYNSCQPKKSCPTDINEQNCDRSMLNESKTAIKEFEINQSRNNTLIQKTKSQQRHQRTLTQQFNIFDSNLSMSQSCKNGMEKRRSSMYVQDCQLLEAKQGNENEQVSQQCEGIKLQRSKSKKENLSKSQSKIQKKSNQTGNVSKPRISNNALKENLYQYYRTFDHITKVPVQKKKQCNLNEKDTLNPSQSLQPLLKNLQSRTRATRVQNEQFRQAITTNQQSTKEDLKKKAVQQKEGSWLQKEIMKDKQKLESTIKTISKVQSSQLNMQQYTGHPINMKAKKI